MTIFAKHSILDVWQGSECASGLSKFFCRDSKRDTRESLIYIKLIMVFTPNLEFSPYSEVIYGITTFKLTKGYQRLKKNKWSTTQSDVFGLYLIFFIRMSQAVSVVNKSGVCYFFTRIKLVARVLACACAMARIK